VLQTIMMRVIVLATIVAAAWSAVWTTDQYIFASIAVDVAYINSTTAVSAVVDTEGESQILFTVDSGKSWGPVYEFDGLRMYSGCAASNSPNQSAVVADIAAFQFTDTESFAFHTSRVPGGFKSQTVDVFGNGFTGDGVSYASVGMRWIDAANGVMISHDQGQSFEFFNISVLRTWARYGAFPSDSVWYVTAGHWPNDNSPPTPTSIQEEYPFSSAVTYKKRKDSTGTIGMYPSLVRPWTELPEIDVPDVDDETQPEQRGDNVGVIPPPGWNTQIVKTTDGGQTWVSQYYNTSYFYFNQITCASETLCVAVGESQTRPGKGKPKVPGIHIFRTTDGETWNEVFFQEALHMSIFGVTFVTPNVVWACGSDLGSDPLYGFFWVSRDAGATWKHEQSLKGVYPMQMSFLDGTHAWAVGPNEVEQSALMRYQ